MQKQAESPMPAQDPPRNRNLPRLRKGSWIVTGPLLARQRPLGIRRQ